jgi:hypothetical protein
MSAAVSRAQQLRKAGRPEGERAVELADIFCRTTRRRVAALFSALRSNDDVAKYRTARRILDGEHQWLESGLVPFDPVRELSAELLPREAIAARS